MGTIPSILCVGSALWDVIGIADQKMSDGHDSPGRIARRPGGVALNIARALARHGKRPGLLTAIGNDDAGAELVLTASGDGIDCGFVARTEQRTDIYMAIEAEGAVFGAVADCTSLETVGARILAPLTDGRIGSAQAPYKGTAIVDGNLPETALIAFSTEGLVTGPKFFVPASPGKATRMRRVLGLSDATLIMNRVEAEILFETTFATSAEAAQAIRQAGAEAIVTDGPYEATVSRGTTTASMTPPNVTALALTGAGDVFVAGFVAAASENQHDALCLQSALDAAAAHVAGGNT